MNSFRKIAEQHWEYNSELINHLLKAFNIEVNKELLELLRFLYVEAMIHGYKHRMEEE